MESNSSEINLCAQCNHSFLRLALNQETDDLFDWKATGASRIQSHPVT